MLYVGIDQHRKQLTVSVRIVVQPEDQSTHKTDPRDASGLSEVLWINRDRIAA